MRDHFITRASVAELLRRLNTDARIFLRDEIKLVKKEISESGSRLGRQAAALAVGGSIVGVGSVFLLASVAFVLAFAFQKIGLNALLAVFLGFVITGLLVTMIGAVIGIKAIKVIKTISKHSLAPHLTMQAFASGETRSRNGPELSVAELHREALAAKIRINEEQQELRNRMDPSQLMKQATGHIRTHPLSWSAAALAGGYFIGRKLLRA